MISVRVEEDLYQEINRYILEQKLKGESISKNGFIIEAIIQKLEEREKGLKNANKSEK